MLIVKIACPDCKHPVSDHGPRVCEAQVRDPKPYCYCNLSAKEVMIMLIEQLALAAQFSANAIKNGPGFGPNEQIALDKLAFEKLTQALVGIEIVEDEVKED